jgi:phenylalanyl-tRNA synthetase alpha chain
MADASARLEELRRAADAEISEAREARELEDLRVRYLGRKSELTGVLRSIGELPPEQRGPVGKAANEVRRALEGHLAERSSQVETAELERRLRTDRIDVTLPGDPPQPVGHLHLVSQTRREMEDIFIGLGFNVVEGPEVEYDYYNFTALNHPPDHPARMLQDTFYFSDEVLLRTHTSPMQVRAMEVKEPPIYIVVPGRVYRRDSDATHTPMFHQLEGLAVDEEITLADLQGVLLEFARAMFGEEREIRLRSGYFPFTEPSVEVDVSCFVCGGGGWLPPAGVQPADLRASGSVPAPIRGSRCHVCKGSGWVEILGAGMVDPNVLEFVKDNGYDPERVQGFAFGMGIDRIAMLKHGVPDLRMLFENDVRLLEQFGAGASA